ncbi:MAG TPA: hypothetical protein VMW47_10735 [Verrucomicrobiae bacterium]|nr:hypothetical protein [Verrucomicrobiae bacterium]
MARAGEDPETLTPSEQARIRRRDRRRRTAMVVDNGGVKRIQLALRARRRPLVPTETIASGAKTPAAGR